MPIPRVPQPPLPVPQAPLNRFNAEFFGILPKKYALSRVEVRFGSC